MDHPDASHLRQRPEYTLGEHHPPRGHRLYVYIRRNIKLIFSRLKLKPKAPILTVRLKFIYIEGNRSVLVNDDEFFFPFNLLSHKSS